MWDHLGNLINQLRLSLKSLLRIITNTSAYILVCGM